MSAIVDDHDGNYAPVTVMIALHDGMNSMDVMGPLKVFTSALHNKADQASKAFRIIFAGAQEHTTMAEGATFRHDNQITYQEAMKRISEVDVLVIPGSNADLTLQKNPQPITLVKAYAAQQQKSPDRERTLMGVSTASLALAEAGVLSGLAATTDPNFVTKLEIVGSNAAQRDLADRTDVMEARYVVNNLRFELGENEDENPYILSRKELKEHKRRKSSSAGKLPSPIEEPSNGANGANGRRPSSARKGSMSLKMSNSRRESVLRRANSRLGGLRVLTTGGTFSGIDGALYLVGALVSEESADEVVREMDWNWRKGVVVDGIDV